MTDKFRDECGIFGIFGSADAVTHTVTGLYALQHRGQESCGVAVSDGRRIASVRRMGGVPHLREADEVKALAGTLAIGHVRYSTVGDSSLINAQPLTLDLRRGPLALCHNGQLGNVDALAAELDVVLATGSDSEIVLHLCDRSTQPAAGDALAEILLRLSGAFSLALLTESSLIAARDPHGFRPLCLGRLGDATIVCSETCALDAVGGQYVGEVEPGDVVVIDASGMRTIHTSTDAPRAHCVFEHVYFARPDSDVFGENVGTVRLRSGRILAREAPAAADLIVPIPDSGMWLALGYHEASGIPLGMGLVRNAYMGRTFIRPSNCRRDGDVRLKLNPVRGVLAGKRVVLLDDSIVRGTTMRETIAAVRAGGASEVHVRIGSPPVVAPCFYGIDTPTRAELIAGQRPSLEDLRRTIGADSLAYLSLDGLREAVGERRASYCTACYTGRYLVAPGAARGGVDHTTSFDALVAGTHGAGAASATS